MSFKPVYDMFEELEHRICNPSPEKLDRVGNFGYPSRKYRRPGWVDNWAFKPDYKRTMEPPKYGSFVVQVRDDRPMPLASSRKLNRFDNVKPKIDTGLRWDGEDKGPKSTAGPCYENGKRANIMTEKTNKILDKIFEVLKINVPSDSDSDTEKGQEGKVKKEPVKEEKVEEVKKNRRKEEREIKVKMKPSVEFDFSQDESDNECLQEQKRTYERFVLEEHEKATLMDLAEDELFEVFHKKTDHLTRVVKNRGYFDLDGLRFFVSPSAIDPSYISLRIFVGGFILESVKLVLKKEGILQLKAKKPSVGTRTFEFYIKRDANVTNVKGGIINKRKMLEIEVPI